MCRCEYVHVLSNPLKMVKDAAFQEGTTWTDRSFSDMSSTQTKQIYFPILLWF